MMLDISEEVLRVIFFGVFGFDAVFLLASLLLVPLYFRYNDQREWGGKALVLWLLLCIGFMGWLLSQFDQPPFESESILATASDGIGDILCPYVALITATWHSAAICAPLHTYFDLGRFPGSKPLLLLLCMIPGMATIAVANGWSPNEDGPLDGDLGKVTGLLSLVYSIPYTFLLTKLWPRRRKVPAYGLWILQATFCALVGATCLVFYAAEYYHKILAYEYRLERVNNGSPTFDVIMLLFLISTRVMMFVISVSDGRRSAGSSQQSRDCEQQAQQSDESIADEEKVACASPNEVRYEPSVFSNTLHPTEMPPSYGSIPRGKENGRLASWIRYPFGRLIQMLGPLYVTTPNLRQVGKEEGQWLFDASKGQCRCDNETSGAKRRELHYIAT